MVRFWILLFVAVGFVTAQSNEYYDDDYKDMFWSQEAADDVLGLAQSSEDKKETGHILDDYVLEPEPEDTFDDTKQASKENDDDKFDDAAASLEDDDDNFDDGLNDKDENVKKEESFEDNNKDKNADIDKDDKFDDELTDEQENEEIIEDNKANENEESDKAVEKEIKQYQKELDDSDVFDEEQKEAKIELPSSNDEAIIEETKNILEEDDDAFGKIDNGGEQKEDQTSAEINDENKTDEEIKKFDEIIEDQQEEIISSFEENASDVDKEPDEKTDDIVKGDVGVKKVSAEDNKLDADDDDTAADDHSKKTNSDEDTVDKVYKDLQEDIAKLYSVWDKLNDNDEAWNDDVNVEEYEEKYGRPFRESNVLAQREDYEAYDEDVDLNIDSNLKDIFAAHENKKDDDQQAVDPLKEILESNRPDDDMKSARIYDNDGLVANDVSKTDVLESKVEETSQSKESSTFKHINVDDLNPDQYKDLIRQFKDSHAEELNTQREDFGRSLLPIHLDLTDFDDDTELTVDGVLNITYPGPYQNNNVVDWILEGNGLGVELNVSELNLRGANGDYLLIKPGGADETAHDGLLFTFHLNEPRRFRFTDVNRVLVRFVAGTGLVGVNNGFKLTAKMIWPLENFDDIDVTTPEPFVPPYTGSHTVHLAGMILSEFKTIEDEFHRLLAEMATMYINRNNIDPGMNTTMETTTMSASHCNRHWPNFETCIEIRFSIPLIPEEGEATRLNERDLAEMWDFYSSRDPFAARLNATGLSLYEVPNDSRMLTMWMILATGVVVCAILLGLALWRFSCIEDYTRMKTFSDTDSVREYKQNLDLYPTPHQNLPPLYSDDFKWADTNYEDTSRVDLGGIANTSYVRDELLDIDSDEDVIPKRDRYATDV